jgi:hypothetical protein
MKAFKKTVFVGFKNKTKVYAFIEVEINEGKTCISISGVEGPHKNGNCSGGCGQIGYLRCTGGDVNAIKLHNVWKRWHLNDMRAGTPEQMEALREAKINGYDEACQFLKEKGLYEVDGYRYGSKWLHEEPPQEVIDFLESLPSTDKCPW